MYYDYGPILDRAALINMIVGGRGIGKTYGAKDLAILDWIKHGWEFIYLRRYGTELQNISSYFADIAHKYPECEWRVKGHLAQARPADSDHKWSTVGYFMSLSKAGSVKSVAFPKVRKIIYDEFLLAKGFTRYIPHEVTALFEFINTVDRYEDRVQAFLVANGVDVVNPYFLHWQIQPHLGEIRRYADGLVVADFPRAEAYAAHARSSRLGRLTAGTDYERYALGNEAIAGASEYLARKTPTADYQWSISHGGWAISFWYDRASKLWYVQRKQPRKPTTYALTVRDASEHTVIEPNDGVIKILRHAYRTRAMYFESHQTHAAFQAILAFLNTK